MNKTLWTAGSKEDILKDGPAPDMCAHTDIFHPECLLLITELRGRSDRFASVLPFLCGARSLRACLTILLV